MPEIEFAFIEKGQQELTDIWQCRIYSMNGMNDQNNQACIQKVQKFLLDHESENSKLVYATHGWRDGGTWLLSLAYNIFKRYGYGNIIVGVVQWNTGAHASRSITPSRSTKSQKHWYLCKSNICHYGLCCLFPVVSKFYDYGRPSVNTWPVGNVIAYVHHEITKDVKPITYCIGFSLGAHVCGFFGKMTRLLNKNEPIYKIIGLDPAGPMFEHPDHDPELRLNRNNAENVEIWHTNTYQLGFEDAIGHVDLYINGGGLQPHCPTYENVVLPHQCSHQFARRLFYHLLNNQNLPCYAKWKCKTRSGADLTNIKKENVDQLESANCYTKEVEDFEVGNLFGVKKNQFGVFWIQIDETSKTCKFNHT